MLLSPRAISLLCATGLALALALAALATLATDPSAAASRPHARRAAPRPVRRGACRATKHHRCPQAVRRPKRKPAPKARPKPRKPAAVTGTGAAAALPPQVVTGTTQELTGSAATVLAQVDPGGRATTLSFQYGTTLFYGAETSTQAIGAVQGLRPVAAALSGLTPMTHFHYRVVASTCGGCAAGTAYGQDATFTTGGFANSVFDLTEAPDPYVLDNGATHNDYWAYTTGERFPILHSSDLVHWSAVGRAMTARPTWALQSGDWHPWAPSVINLPEPCPGTSSSSCYVMYYVAVSAQFSVNCVAVATSPTPGGPFVDQGPLSNGTLDASGRPIGCGDNHGYGMIDPSPFLDPSTGQRYLYGSEDFACPPASSSCTPANRTLQPTVSVIPLAGDGLSATAGRTPLFTGTPGSWEGSDVSVPTVEGPTMMLHAGVYYLLYSGGGWHGHYAMGYATASSPTGPFTKAGSPILTGTTAVLGPGGGDATVTGPHGGTWLVYHGRQSSYANPRVLRVDPFAWRPGPAGIDVPSIAGPTSTAQPLVP